MTGHEGPQFGCVGPDRRPVFEKAVPNEEGHAAFFKQLEEGAGGHASPSSSGPLSVAERCPA